MQRRKLRELSRKFGFSSLSDKELFALIIQRGTRIQSVYSIAKEIELIFNINIDENKSAEEFIDRLKGRIPRGSAYSASIGAIFELVRRYYTLDKAGIRIPASPELLIDQVFPSLARKKEEYVYGLYLSTRLTLIRKKLLTKGTIDFVVLEPHDVYYYAIKYRSRNVIIVHNHPSGNSSPSKADYNLTERLWKSAKILGVNLLDHIIVAKNGVFSFKNEGGVL